MIFSREQRVGLFFLGAVMLFVGFIEATVGTGLFARGTRVWAEFPDVQGLTSGAQVRVSGVKAGAVREIRLEPDRVRVALELKKGIELREDAVARLDFQALSGARFVTIDRGSPDRKVLSPGATIRGESAAGISQMVDELDKVGASLRNLADSLNENQDRLLKTVSEMLEENRQGLAQTVKNLGGITDKLNSGQGTLGKLLADPTLYDEAAAALASLRDSFGDISKVTGRLARGEGLLGKLLTDDGTYDDLRESVAGLHLTVENFTEVSERVRRGEGTLGRLVADDSLYNSAEGALNGVSRATRGIEDQAPISVLGTFIGTLF
ncbi:MAG TPA: MlaD family protein [Candidatus Binatia bacterium]|nr:MlaD family protein [Candidatus Binatia bacterium]